MPSDYRVSRPLAVRLLGSLLVAEGLLVLVTTLLVMALDLPWAVLGAVVLLTAVGTLVAVLLLGRRASVVRLDDVGYRVRLVRGAGVTEARWTDVEDAVATTIAGERCVQLRLRDGRTTTIPVRLLEGDPDDFAGDVRDHLDKGHGYRRLR